MPSSSIERFIASCSNEAELIWKVMREAPPGCRRRRAFSRRALANSEQGSALLTRIRVVSTFCESGEFPASRNYNPEALEFLEGYERLRFVGNCNELNAAYAADREAACGA